MSKINTIRQRIKDFRGFCGAERIRYSEVCHEAGLNYDSVIVNMRRGDLSEERMTLLEETAIKLKEAKELEKTHA